MEVKKGDTVRSLVNYGYCVSGSTYAVYGPSSFAPGSIHVCNSKGNMGDILTANEYEHVTTLTDLGGMMGMDMEQHSSGALRESKEGKGLPHLVLAGFPRALTALSKHVDCELGRDRNWEKGLPESSLISSQFRHLMGYTSGVSEDTPEYNLTANLWNAIVLLEEYMRVQDGVMSDDVLDVEKGGEG